MKHLYQEKLETNGEIDSNDYAVCPYCFYENFSLLKYKLQNGDCIQGICDLCGKQFTLTLIMEQTWFSKKTENKDIQ